MSSIEIGNLHVLTDSLAVKPRSLMEVIEQVINGGATVIQLRDKTSNDDQMVALGRELQKLTKGKIPLIVNDKINVALEIDADGVHVGQSDTPASKVRKLIGPNMILGVSTSTVEEAKRAEADGADYLGIGPIFPTHTKTDAVPPIGLENLGRIKAATSIPIIAIGGITHSNAREVMLYADGVAVISAVLRATNPQRATHELSVVINSVRKIKKI